MKKWKFEIECKSCKESYTLTFKNQKADWRDYALALDWQLSQKCPMCKKKKLTTPKK